jgi:hypothetical protein
MCCNYNPNLSVSVYFFNSLCTSGKIGNSCFERVEDFMHLRTDLINQNSIHEEFKSRLKSGNAFAITRCRSFYSPVCYQKNLKIKVHRTIILLDGLYGCETWSLTLTEELRLKVNEDSVLRRLFGSKRDEVTWEMEKITQ